MEQELIERLKGLSLDASLKDKQDWDELAIALGGSWQEKRGELENLRLLINSDLTIDDLKKKGELERKKGGVATKENKGAASGFSADYTTDIYRRTGRYVGVQKERFA